MMSSSIGIIDATNATKLALIYSRLKAMEIEKDQPHPFLEINKRFVKSKVDPQDIEDVTAIFRDAISNVRLKLIGDSRDNGNGVDAIDNVRVLFLAEEQYAQSLIAALDEKIKHWRAVKTERDQNINQMFQKRQGLVTLENQIRELEEICRNLQKIAKEKDDQRGQLVMLEKEKSDQLQTECIQSIDTVTKKIEEEEFELEQKAKENEDLQAKLEQFTYHMSLRKEKARNEEKARELQMQLEYAKRAQVDYFREQQDLKSKSLKSRVIHLQETVHSLKTQLGSYTGKFEEFEDTLRRSGSVLEKVDEREIALTEILLRMREDSANLKHKSTEADVSIIKALEHKRVEEFEYNKAKSNFEKLEKKCRKLMLQRQEILKKTQLSKASPILECGDSSSSQIRTESPDTTNLKPSTTPSRRIHNFVMSSSSSPSRPTTSNSTGLVGDGSPVNSPSVGERKQIDHSWK